MSASDRLDAIRARLGNRAEPDGGFAGHWEAHDEEDSASSIFAPDDIAFLLAQVDRLRAQLDAIPDVICGHSAYRD